ncbi:MAG TPA: NADH-quinone oxidoreductase subunit J, partial [Lentzea sp.]
LPANDLDHGVRTVAAALLGIGFAVLMVGSVGRALTSVEPAGLAEANTTNGGNVGNIGTKLFTDYLFAFELTSALLITAALGAMILAFVGRDGKPAKKTQKELVEERFQDFKRVGSIPGPGVFATANSVATPALLPDGSVAEESLFEVIEATDKSVLSDDVAEVAGTAHEADAHALKGSES